MKLYCNLKLKGIENESDFNSRFTGINKIVNLDDIHFVVPNTKNSNEDYVNIHLDFEDIDSSFIDGEVVLRLKGLADTWNDLNKEDGIEKEDITLELLQTGSLENYVMFFDEDNGDVFKDIIVTAIGYVNESGQAVRFNIDECAANEA